jgi:ferredoxin--NADP+ reductase
LKKYRIAIVGAGPTGYFTAQAFLKNQTADTSFLIDIIERLPTPGGLVRYGVAPDHQKIKSITNIFEKINQESNVRLFANIEVGKDVSLRDLKMNYDAVVLTTGAPNGKRLNIEGENSPNSFSASEFVAWYNGDPNFTNLNVNLKCESAVIVGNGNVAIDVARLLALDPNILTKTDIPEYALQKLFESQIKKIYICGRRGPENTNFTNLELQNLCDLEGVSIKVNLSEIMASKMRINTSIEVNNMAEKNLNTFQEKCMVSRTKVRRNVEFKFFISPKKILNKKSNLEIIFEIMDNFEDEKIRLNKLISIEAGIFISAVGNEAVEIPGIEIEKGRIKNIAGKLFDNIYTAGWAKRGAIGLIGTNKSDASEVVNLIISELGLPKSTNKIDKLFRSKNTIIDKSAWAKINSHEISAGALIGKPRSKLTSIDEIVRIGLDNY